MGPTVTRLIQDPLAVSLHDNQLYMEREREIIKERESDKLERGTERVRGKNINKTSKNQFVKRYSQFGKEFLFTNFKHEMTHKFC